MKYYTPANFNFGQNFRPSWILTICLSSNRLETYSIVFVTLKNIYLDTKIMKIGQLIGVLSPFLRQPGIGGHLGGHLGFWKMLQGSKTYPPDYDSGASPVLESSEKKSISAKSGYSGLATRLKPLDAGTRLIILT